MKKLIASVALILGSCSYSYAGQPVTYSYDITPTVTIYLTDEPCMMFTPPKDISLFKASAKDVLTVASVEGCWSRGSDNRVEIKLLNIKDKKFYDFVLPEALFTQVPNV